MPERGMSTRDTDDFEFEDMGGDPSREAFDIWGLALRRKWLIIFAVFLASVLGTLLYVSTDPTYEATAEVLIRPKSQSLPVEGFTTPMMQRNVALLDHAYVLSSPLVIGLALERKELQLSQDPGGQGAIRRGLEVEPIEEGSNVLQISYVGADAEDCATLVNAIVDSYREFLGQAQKSIGEETLRLITAAGEDLRRELLQKEQAYDVFRSESPLVWQEDQATNIHQLRQAQIEEARAQVMLENSRLEARIRAINEAVDRGTENEVLLMIFEQADNSQVESPFVKAESELLPLKLEEELLSLRYGKDHPRRRAKRRQVDLIRELYQSDENLSAEAAASSRVRLHLASLQEQLQSGREVVQQLDTMFQGEQKQAKDMVMFELQAATHEREIERTRTMFDSVVERVKEISLLEAYGGDEYIFRVLSPAIRGKKVAPSLARFLLIAVVLGGAAGFGLAFLVDSTERTFRSPEEITKTLRLPLVGHIPGFQAQEEANPSSPLSPALVAAHMPKSPIAEEFRAVRTALLFSIGGKSHSVIQITSPLPGDGKSTLCANVAVTLAQSGKRVVVLDGDFRRPTQHKLFGLKMDTGLASIVDGQVEMLDAIQETGVENLSVIACGPRPPNPSELLTSPQFEKTLAVLRGQYDYVFVDTPPILAVTDPCIVAPRVDGVMLVVRLRKNSRPNALRARDSLLEMQANIVGVVVNGLGSKAVTGYGYGYGYGGRYQYQYGYGHSGSRETEAYFSDGRRDANVES